MSKELMDCKAMTLDEYIASEERNLFWKLSPGEVQNLLDEAIERIEELEREAKK